MGIGSQALLVIPGWRSIVVHQADMTEFLDRFLEQVRDDGVEANAALKELVLACLRPAEQASQYCREDRLILRREFDGLVGLIAAARR